jgi:hypothetical protein
MALLLCSGRDAASLARMLADQSLTPLMATLAVVVVECVPDPASASHGGRVRSNASRRTAVVRRNSSAHVWRPGCCGGKVVDTAGFDPVEVPAGGDVVAPGPPRLTQRGAPGVMTLYPLTSATVPAKASMTPSASAWASWSLPAAPWATLSGSESG